VDGPLGVDLREILRLLVESRPFVSFGDIRGFRTRSCKSWFSRAKSVVVTHMLGCRARLRLPIAMRGL
jgi:hypothetical protein